MDEEKTGRRGLRCLARLVRWSDSEDVAEMALKLAVCLPILIISAMAAAMLLGVYMIYNP